MKRVLLEKLCRRPNNIRILLVLPDEDGIRQIEVSHMGLGEVSPGAFYGSLKELMQMKLVERYMVDGIYYLRLTEKGKKVKRLFEEIMDVLGE